MNMHSIIGNRELPTIIEMHEAPAVDLMLTDLCSSAVALEDLARTDEGLAEIEGNIVHFASAMILLGMVHNRLKRRA